MKSSEGVTLVIGLGEVGKPLCTILQKHDASVIGIDIEPVTVDQPVGILHVCFPFKEQARFEDAVAEYAHKYRPQIIVVNSTVVPGTTRGIEVRTGIPSVSSPIRGKHTKMVDDLYLYVKFVAGANAEATERVRAHFEAAGLKSETISTPEALELAKLLETTYFGLLITWAQEMNRFAGTVNADYLEIGKVLSRDRLSAQGAVSAGLYWWPLRDAEHRVAGAALPVGFSEADEEVERGAEGGAGG